MLLEVTFGALSIQLDHAHMVMLQENVGDNEKHSLGMEILFPKTSNNYPLPDCEKFQYGHLLEFISNLLGHMA
jgi:hypothetical protein